MHDEESHPTRGGPVD